MEVALAGLTGLPSIEKFACNVVDYTFDLLGGLVLLFMWRLSLESLLVVSLSPSIFYFIPSSISVVTPMLILLVSFGSFSCLLIILPLYELG